MRTKPMIRLQFVLSLLLAAAVPAMAQDAPPAAEAVVEVEAFDTSYFPSAAVSYRVKRTFLDGVFRSAGADARAKFQEQFDAKPPDQIWASLVDRYGMRTGNVADAMAAYWMLNWMVANAAFAVDIPAAPVRQQLTLALANDRLFATLRNDQRQEMAERLMLDFLVLHAAMNTALANQDTLTLQALAREAVISFRQQYRVDLLALEPTAAGLTPRPPAEGAEAPPAEAEPAPPSSP